MNRALVTGGAGFIGSHLVDRLILDYNVVVLDDLSRGSLDNLSSHRQSKRFTFIEGSITSEQDVNNALKDVQTVFHFAAQPNVRVSTERPLWDFNTNVAGSLNLLEAMRNQDVTRMVFASSGGTVYGDTELFPTPETTPFRPISNYGAAKGAIEMYLSSYSELYEIDSISMRLGNVIGPRLDHGVIYDFYMKLRRSPDLLHVLGNGKQEKAYISVDDTVEAAVLLANKMRRGYIPVNVASGERLTVTRIAEIVIEELNLQDTRIEYSGGERGWAGDVVLTDIDVNLLKSFGWSIKTPIEEGIRRQIRWLVDRFGPVG